MYKDIYKKSLLYSNRLKLQLRYSYSYLQFVGSLHSCLIAFPICLSIALGLCCAVTYAYADDVATELVLINNYDSRQNQDIWQRMRAGFKLEHKQTSRVQYYERLYTKNPKAFTRLMANAKPYLYYLLTEIERYGMPSEIALIPGVESSFNPLAANLTDSYAGMWQFIPLTGRRFKMRQNDDLDERRDIVKSTRSALDYLNYLHHLFGQWEIAIGAYNWGEGNMYKAVINSGEPLGRIEYSNLELRQITADYVPKIIALASIIEDPKKFGVVLDDSTNQPYFAIVTPANGTTVTQVEKLSGIDNKTFIRLNPQFKDSDYVLKSNNHILLPLTNQSVYYASLGRAIILQNDLSNIQAASADSSITSDDLAAVAVFFQDEKVESSASIIDAVAVTFTPTESIITAESATSPVTPHTVVDPKIESGLDSLINTLDTVSNEPTVDAVPLIKVKSTVRQLKQ